MAGARVGGIGIGTGELRTILTTVSGNVPMTGEDAMDGELATPFLFLGWLPPVGSALRFLAWLSGAGVPRGLDVLGLVILLPKTPLIARSMGTPLLVLVLLLVLLGFSTFRLLGAGVPLVGVALAMPRPIGVGDSLTAVFVLAAGFRLFAPVAAFLFVPGSALCSFAS